MRIDWHDLIGRQPLRLVGRQPVIRLVLGYGPDFSTCRGFNRFAYNITQHGPRIGFAFHF